MLDLHEVFYNMEMVSMILNHHQKTTSILSCLPFILCAIWAYPRTVVGGVLEYWQPKEPKHLLSHLCWTHTIIFNNMEMVWMVLNLSQLAITILFCLPIFG